MLTTVIQDNKIIKRSDNLLGIIESSSEDQLTEADIEYNEKRKSKIDSINTEIERRKTAFENI
jgi:hypothetical protein